MKSGKTGLLAAAVVLVVAIACGFFVLLSGNSNEDDKVSSTSSTGSERSDSKAPLEPPTVPSDPARRAAEEGEKPAPRVDAPKLAVASVHGVLLDRDSSQPVAAAKVVALRVDGSTLERLTTQNGRFEFKDLDDGESIVIHTEALGFAPPREPPRVKAHQDGGEDVVVRVAHAIVLRGRLLDEDGRGVMARLEIRRGSRRLSLESDANGAFMMNDLAGRLGFDSNPPEALGQLWTRSTTHLDAFRSLRRSELERGDEIEIRLTKGGSILGRCVAVGDVPLRDLNVVCYSRDSSRFASMRSTRTDALGNFRFGGLDAGVYRIEPAATTDDLAPNHRSIEIEVQDAREVSGAEFIYGPGFSIGGSVVDRKDESPLPDRIVLLNHDDWLEPQLTVSDEKGEFHFGPLTEGKYTVVLRGISLRDPAEPQIIEVAAGVTDIRFKVDEPLRDGVLALKLYDAASGKPLEPGTEVSLHVIGHGDNDRRVRFASGAICEEGGVAVLRRLRRWRYEVEIIVGGFATKRVEFNVTKEAERIELDVPLVVGVTVRGRVLDPSGKPIEGARVASFRKDALDLTLTDESGVLSDVDGAFTLEHVPLEESYVAAKASGLAASRVALEAGNRDVAGLTLRLSHGVTIYGYVHHPNGYPAYRFLLELTGAVAAESASTDDSGRFEFEDVEPGPFTIRDGDGAVLYEDTVGEEPLEVELEVPD